MVTFAESKLGEAYRAAVESGKAPAPLDSAAQKAFPSLYDGGSSSGGGRPPTQTPAPVYTSDITGHAYSSAAAQAAAEQALRQQQAQEQARRQAEQRAAEQAQQQKTIVLASGGVRTYGGGVAPSVSYGGAQVQGTGMTAAEYRRQIQQQAVSSGQVKRGEEGRYTYTITSEKAVEETAPSADVSRVDLVTGGLSLFEASREQSPTGAVFLKPGEMGLPEGQFGFIADPSNAKLNPILRLIQEYGGERGERYVERKVAGDYEYKLKQQQRQELLKEITYKDLFSAKDIGGIYTKGKMDVSRVIKFGDTPLADSPQVKLDIYAGLILSSARFPKITQDKLIFGGITQIAGKPIQTDLLFKTQSGKTGAVRGFTAANKGVAITVAKGTQGIKVYDLTKGKFFLSNQQQFTGGQISFYAKLKNIVYSAGAGKVKVGKTIKDFFSFGGSQQIDDFIVSAGGTIQKGGVGTDWTGLLKAVDSSDDLVRIVSSGVSAGGRVSSTGQIFSMDALQATQAITSASIPPIITSTGGVAGSGLSLLKSVTSDVKPIIKQEIKPIIKQVQINLPKQKIIQVSLPTTKQSTRQRITPTQATAQLTSQLTAQRIVQTPKLRLRQEVVPMQISMQSLSLAQGLRQSQRQIQKQQLKLVTPTPFVFPFPPTIPKEIPKLFPLKFPKAITPRQPRGLFPVLGRRFGKFKVVGVGKTEREAFSLGKQFVGKTLAATFKVPSAMARQLPGYKTKLTKEGALYIEPRKRRLKKRGTEVKEIQLYKGLKGGRKR